MSEPITAAVRRWLFEDALPFWAKHGVDRVNGGFVEDLALDGRDGGADFKRTRVACRQIYVFSHAELLGRKGSVAIARQGFDYLTRRAWLGPAKGWARLLDREGRVKDAAADLYDIAFVLFALGWYHRVSGDPEALAWSLSTLDFLDAQMRHPGGKGFFAEKPESGPRKQNPHMHLLEATLVNLKASRHPRFRALADELVALACNHFYDTKTQTLGEYFNADWSRVAGEEGRTIEPGHQFEWAWILADYQQMTGRDIRPIARGLVDFAEAHGVDRTSGATYNSVRDDGVALDRRSRTWPNTERIQAAVAMFELEGRDPRPVFEESGRLLLDRYLAHTPRGTWIDQFGPDGAPLAEKIPASTLYHVMIAFAEMLRVEEAVALAFPANRERG